MWKCPACETLNDNDVCVICGEPRPASGADYTPPAAPSYTPPADPYVTGGGGHTGYSSYVPPRSEPLDSAPKIDYSVPAYSPEMARDSLDPAAPLEPAERLDPSKSKKKSHTGTIITVIILAVIAILVIVGISYNNVNDSSYDSSYSSGTLEPYYEGYEKWGYKDSSGNIVVDCIYTEANDFVNGMARVRDSYGDYGFINENGNPVIPCIYDDATDFYDDGTAHVLLDGEWFWINSSGVRVD